MNSLQALFGHDLSSDQKTMTEYWIPSRRDSLQISQLIEKPGTQS